MKKTLKLLGVLFFLASCKTETEQHIVGKWQAIQLTECDNLVPIQTELVDIEFSSDGKYIFHSTLNVREEGNYRIKKNYLFTQDKLRDNAPEKAVLIKSLDADSMVLQMSYKGKDQYLTLAKEGANDKKQDNQQDSQAVALAAGAATVATAAVATSNNASDSIQKVEAAKKAEEEKEKQAEAEADKKREAEADRKREEAKKKSKEESSSSSSEAYKKREAKRKAEERQAKEEAEKRAEKFRREYAKREAEKRKKK